MTIKVTDYTFKRTGAVPHVRVFSLTCNRTGGTLPLAARVCRDITLHPRAMLDPPRAQTLCLPGKVRSRVEVTATFNGRTTHLGGLPGCGWPGGAQDGVWDAATQRDESSLTAFERQLRCDDDPALLAEPTPWTLVEICQRGPGSRRPGLFVYLATNAINESQPFPMTPGSRRCTIIANDISRRRIQGRCSVSVRGLSSTPTVTFVESWPQGGRTVQHSWRVVIDDFGGKVVAETGPVPPQHWR